MPLPSSSGNAGSDDDSARSRLATYASLYRSVLNEDRMCLCAILAADDTTLPEPMRSAVTRFFEENEAWLTRVLARSFKEPTRFQTLADRLIADLISGPTSPEPGA